MNKQDLINKLAEDAGVNQVQAERVFAALATIITDALRTDGEIKMGEIGRFTVSHRAACKALNPRTQQQIDVPARNGVKFKAGKALIAAIQ